MFSTNVIPRKIKGVFFNTQFLMSRRLTEVIVFWILEVKFKRLPQKQKSGLTNR